MMTMVGLGWLGGFVMLVAVLATRAPGMSAARRHVVWTAALGVLLLGPLVEQSGLRVEVPVPGAWLDAHPAADVADVGVTAIGSGRAEPARSEVVTPIATVVPTGAARAEVVAPRVRADVPEPRSGAGLRDGTVAPVVVGSADADVAGWTSLALGRWLAGLWALGAFALLSATLFGHLVAWRMTSGGVVEPDPGVSRRLAVLLVRHEIRTRVRLRVSPAVRVPATWGFVRPAIVLPPQHAAWSWETLDRVLLHELAHVERRDCWTHLVGEMARAVHWFNPLAWYAVTRQRTESEHACDDLVLARTGAASAYAEDLLTIACSLRPGGTLPRAALAMVKPSVLAGRVRAVLDPSLARGPVGRARLAGTAAGAALFCLLTTAVVPVASATELDQERPVRQARSEPPAPAAAEVAEAEASLAPMAEPVGVVSGASPAESEPPLSGPDLLEPGLPTPDLSEPVPAPWGAAVGVQERCRYDGEGRRSTRINSDEDRTSIRWETDDCTVEVEIIGDVEFSSDDTQVTRLGRDARFEIEERLRGVRHRIRMEADRDGAIERSYWVDGRSTPWDTSADAWLASILPELFRQTTINAEARVRRMLREGGPDRVFAETDRIHSDHVKGYYLELLMAEADLTEAEYVRVVEAATEIESDHGATELILAVIAEAGMRDAFQEPILTGVDGIDSDHQKTRVLEVLLRSDLSTEQFDAVLRAAMHIDSDHNLSVVLQAVAREGTLSIAGRASYLAAVRSIDSDHNRGEVINAFLDVGTLSDQELGAVIEMTEGMESDHQRGQVLQRIAGEYSLSGAQLDAYLNSARRIESDHQIGMTADAVIGAPAFGAEHLRAVLALADEVESDHNRAMILHSLTREHDLASDEIFALLEVARGIGSDHQLAVTLEEVIHDETLTDRDVRALLSVAGQLGSSHQRSTVLIELARIHDVEGENRERFLSLTDDLSSMDRERARQALGERRR